MKKLVVTILFSFSMSISAPAKADMFGGDVAVLIQILTNAVKQLIELQNILNTGRDTLQLLHDINRGIDQGLRLIQIVNPKFNPGIYGNIRDANQALAAIDSLYGSVPETSEAKLQTAQDQSVADSIAMHGSLFEFADQVDQESKRILQHSDQVNPLGAAKLQAQSLAILISVNTQVLRSQSAILKLMAQNLAVQNRTGKIHSEEFKSNYEEISTSLKSLPPNPSLKGLGP